MFTVSLIIPGLLKPDCLLYYLLYGSSCCWGVCERDVLRTQPMSNSNSDPATPRDEIEEGDSVTIQTQATVFDIFDDGDLWVEVDGNRGTDPGAC